MTRFNDRISPVVIISEGVETTRYYGIAAETPMTLFVTACGFDPGRTSASDIVVNLDERTVTARVYRYTEDGKRVTGSGGYTSDEVSRPLVGTVPPAEYATNRITNPVNVLETIFAEHYGWDERNDDAIQAILAALFPPKESR